MIWEQLVQDEAAKNGIELTADEAGYILWNETGYPSFHDGKPQEYFRSQVAQWCQKVKSKMSSKTAWKEYDPKSIVGFVYDDEHEELEIYFDYGGDWVGYGLPKYVGNYLSQLGKDLDKQIELGDELAKAADDLLKICSKLNINLVLEDMEAVSTAAKTIDKYKADRKESRKDGKTKTETAKTEKDSG